MNKTEIMTKATKEFYKVGFTLKKHSPEILVVAGVVGTVVSAVLACRATTKVSEIMTDTKIDVDAVHKCLETQSEEDYSKEDGKKDLVIIYAKTSFELAKLYAPSVLLGVASITSILASNNILRKRNVALTAAYATLDKCFKEYRGNVVERFGEQVDRELRYAIKAKKFEETVVDEKTGKEKTVKNKVDVVGIDGISDYAKFFDEYNPNWEKDSEYNLMFLRAQQNYANDLLVKRGYLFLNDVYKMLGFEPTRAGQVVGWRYEPEKSNCDGYVSFGIYNANRETARDFVNGYERSILLDFNVDGPILDTLDD